MNLRTIPGVNKSIEKDLNRCAVYFANEQKHDPKLLKWWDWKDK